MRTCIVVNPVAGGGRVRRLWPELHARLRALRCPITIRWTTAAGTAPALTRSALREGFDRIVAVGGDGTLHEVVNGFFEDDTPVNPSAVLALLPCGSGSDFRRSLDLPMGLDAVSRLRSDRIHAMDVLRLQYARASGERARRYAVNVASFGLSGTVVEMLGPHPRLLPASVRYLGAALFTLAVHRPARIRLTLDGEPLGTPRVRLAAVANGHTFAAGLPIAPGARPDDGQLDAVVLRDIPRRTLLRHLSRFYRGTHTGLDGVTIHRGRRFTAHPTVDSDPVRLEADGELLGRLPLTVEVVSEALRVQH